MQHKHGFVRFVRQFYRLGLGRNIWPGGRINILLHQLIDPVVELDMFILCPVLCLSFVYSFIFTFTYKCMPFSACFSFHPALQFVLLLRLFVLFILCSFQ